MFCAEIRCSERLGRRRAGTRAASHVFHLKGAGYFGQLLCALQFGDSAYFDESGAGSASVDRGGQNDEGSGRDLGMQCQNSGDSPEQFHAQAPPAFGERGRSVRNPQSNRASGSVCNLALPMRRFFPPRFLNSRSRRSKFIWISTTPTPRPLDPE